MNYRTAREILSEAIEQLDEVGPNPLNPLMINSILKNLHAKGKLPISTDWRNDPTVHPYWKKRWSSGGRGDNPPGLRNPPERINPWNPDRPLFDQTPNNPYGQPTVNPF